MEDTINEKKMYLINFMIQTSGMSSEGKIKRDEGNFNNFNRRVTCSE